MRKLATLLIAAGLVFGAATGASAIDFKAKGEWMMSFDYGQGSGFTSKNANGKHKTGWGNNDQDEFNAKQRVRLQLNAIANENLMGHVFFEIGNQTWGNGGGGMGADDTAVEVRRAYIDWMVPETDLKVRMGIQGMALPSFTMGKSQVFEDDVAGITLSYKFTDNVGVTAFWARPLNDNYAGYTDDNGDTRNKHYMDNIDAFGLTIPLTFDGIKVTPWGMIAAIGPNAIKSGDEEGVSSSYSYVKGLSESSKQLAMGLLPAWGAVSKSGNAMSTYKVDDYAVAWWAGVTADCTMFDPIRIAVDVMGGGVEWDGSRMDRAGWLAAALVEYKMDWGIPGILGWYASGDDDDLGNGSERMPFLTLNNGDNQFSNFALDGNNMISREGIIGSSMAGTWGVGVRVRDMSFIEDLKHTFRFNIIGGTNDSGILKKARAAYGDLAYLNGGEGWGVGAMYLTDEDTAFEIGLRTDYKLYENFDISLDANYITLDMGSDSKLDGRDYEDCWNVNVGFTYSF